MKLIKRINEIIASLNEFFRINFVFTKPSLLSKNTFLKSREKNPIIFSIIPSFLTSIFFSKAVYHYIFVYGFEPYSYFISGNLSLNNAIKKQDFLVVYSLIISFCVAFLFLFYFSKFVNWKTSVEFQSAFYFSMNFLALPGLIQAITIALSVYKGFPIFIFISLLFILFLILLTMLLIKTNKFLKNDLQQSFFILLSPILINFFTFFSTQSILIMLYTDPNSILPRLKIFIYSIYNN